MGDVWERRWHPLRREWVLVATHRDRRPWRGETVPDAPPRPPAHDPGCAFCPGNHRADGTANPDYRGVFVFDNDHPCVAPTAPTGLDAAASPYARAPARGASRVVCYSPRHDLRLADLDVEAIDDLLAHWQRESRDLGARPGVRAVHVFENNGAVVGVSNPHPHGQIYALDFVPPTLAQECAAAADHHRATGRSLWADMVAAERADGLRVLDDLGAALAFVPFCARYAYEIFVGPERAVGHLAALTAAERRAFAGALGRALRRLDGLWNRPMPYVLALHQAPCGGAPAPGYGCHVELHPPLRRPGLLKYLAGPEVGAGVFLADTCAEDKAAELRAVDVGSS